jgi:hypothetical protein
MVDSVHGSWTAGGAGHGGLRPWPAEGLTGARPSGLSGARWLTDDGAMESGARGGVRLGPHRGEGGGVATERWQRRRGGGGARCGWCLAVGRREREREEVRWRMAGLSPFIGAEGGGG